MFTNVWYRLKMTEVVETSRRIGFCGDLKIISIQSNADCASGHTINLNSDATDGRGLSMSKVLNTIAQDDAGLIEEATFDQATGIVTMGTLTATGIHNVLIIGY